MPLGFFGGGSSSKAQPIPSSENGKERREKKEPVEKDARGTLLKLQKATVTIEKKLAEGGFAIVYLVSDKQNRQYALKRQFINDDLKQVEACKREYQIISSLRGHKNIVAYVDHLLSKNASGVYDYMLLTAYYKHSVLQLMNDRLAGGKGLTFNEVLAIFCDMTEAVARLHHSQTPVIHRDLKVENILIDDRNRAAPPIYVLCDFGSATTRVLSTATHPVNVIKEEIERYTTLSYRSPEMVDIYEGKSIGTKSDVWALGVMLYKLCYFSLPFGESALAIQNGAFNFPAQPAGVPDSIKALIYALLDSDLDRRPSIFQCASLAFEAANRDCPVNNVFNVNRIPLSAAISTMQNGRGSSSSTSAASSIPHVPSASGSIGKEATTATLCSMTPQKMESTTTSVNPRLRPKPMTSIPSVPTIPPSPKLPTANPHPTESVPVETSEPPGGTPVETSAPLSCPISKPCDLGFTDLDEAIPRNRAQTEVSHVRGDAAGFTPLAKDSVDAPSTMSLPSAVTVQAHRRNASDTSQIIKSAFKPYSQTVGSSNTVATSSNTIEKEEVPPPPPMKDEAWNPFLAAPFGDGKAEDQKSTKYRDSPSHSDTTSIDSSDPFGAAPFDPLPSSAIRVPEEFVLRADQDETDSVGSAGDLSRKMQQMEDDSEVDEQRMKARRRYSYEHIDGVGEDGSSDSRGRTEGESTDDLSRNDESSHDENDSSQQTDVASDDGGGRPLLEDDGLEDDYEDSVASSSDQFVPLTVDLRNRCTNPFLNADLTPKISPADQSSVWAAAPINNEMRFFPQARKEIFSEDSRFGEIYAPATLPRQVTPLAPKPAPPKPLTGPVVFTAPLPQAPPASVSPSEPLVVGELITVATSPPPKEPQTVPSLVDSVPMKIPGPRFVEGPKTPKPKKSKEKKRIEYRSSGSEFETDGSEAEMCTSAASDKMTTAKKKKKSPAFSLLGSNPAMVGTEKTSSKKSDKRKNSTGNKRGSVGALNASFVNSSFQSEDVDSPPGRHRKILETALRG